VNKQDANWFKDAVNNMLSLHNKPHLGNEILRIWWEVLQPYAKDDISLAFSRYAKQGKFAPKPADIREIIITNDGRPSPDKAWADVLVGMDEKNTVTWTDETSEAWAIARPAWETGDKIGAKLAFHNAYKESVQRARDCGRAAVWSVHQGHDKDQRLAATKEAVSQGLISEKKALASLGYYGQAAETERLTNQNTGAGDKAGFAKFKKMLKDADHKQADKKAQETANKRAKQEERRRFLIDQSNGQQARNKAF